MLPSAALAILVAVAPTAAGGAGPIENESASENTSAIEATSAIDAKSEIVGITLPVMSTLVPVLLGGGLIFHEGEDGLLAGLVLLASGIAIGPSLGHLYAGEIARALVGPGLRTLGLGFGAAMLAYGVDAVDSPNDSVAAGIVAVVFGGALTASAFYLLGRDLFDARAAVRRHNGTEIEVAVAPSLIIDREGALAPAAILSLQF